MRTGMRFFLAVLAAWACAPAFAQDGCGLADPQSVVKLRKSYDLALRTFADANCLGDSKNDPAQLVKDFDALLGKEPPPSYPDPIAVLKMLSRHAADRASGPQAADWHAISLALQKSADLLFQIKDESDPAAVLKIAQQALPLAWKTIDPNTRGAELFNGRTVELLAPTCPLTATTCEAFDNQLEMIRVVNLAVRLRDVTQRPSLVLHFKDAEVQTARWDAYRSKGQHQYPWEVFINGLAMGNDECGRNPDTGIQRGFCAVPTHQWIFAHPDVGLPWVRSASQSSELKPAILIEVIGYYRWAWRSKTSAEMEGQRGISLVSAYTDVDNGRNKWSWGPMFHFGNGYNFAVTKASGEKVSFLININLADRYFGKKQEVTDYLKALKKNPADLLQ